MEKCLITITPTIDAAFQWSKWTARKDNDGKLVYHKALSGDELADFVYIQLFPYLKKFKAMPKVPTPLNIK